MGIVTSYSAHRSRSYQSLISPTLVSTDSISERQSQDEAAKAATGAKPISAPAADAGAAGPAVPPSPRIAASDRGPAISDRGPAMMTAIPGGGDNALPEPLREKCFAGEWEGDFEGALAMVEPGGPTGRRHPRGGIWESLVRLVRLDRLRGPATRADRHVAFDGYSNPMHDEKIERDRRYGTVYTVVEHANAYLVSIEMPRRIPASSLKELWKLPDEMPDYDYTVTLHEGVLAVRAGVRGDAMRRLSYISASFPSDFLTRVEFDQPVSSFKHRMRNKVLEIVVFKAAGSAAVGRVA
jgi:hypothetical protein